MFQVRVCSPLSWRSRSGYALPHWLFWSLLQTGRVRRKLHNRDFTRGGLTHSEAASSILQSITIKSLWSFINISINYYKRLMHFFPVGRFSQRSPTPGTWTWTISSSRTKFGPVWLIEFQPLRNWRYTYIDRSVTRFSLFLLLVIIKQMLVHFINKAEYQDCEQDHTAFQIKVVIE